MYKDETYDSINKNNIKIVELINSIIYIYIYI